VRRLWMVAALGLQLAAPAWAQDQGLGLDLSAPPEPEKKPEEKPKEEKPKEEKPPDFAPPPTEAPAAAKQPGELTEHEVILQDRVKAVEQRSTLKRMRLELSPALAISVNDPFYTKYAGGLWAMFYPQDSIGIGLRGMYFFTYATYNVPTAQQDLLSLLPESKPIWDLMFDAQWTPFYGKVAVYNTIAQFDLFVVAGIGVVASQTTFISGINEFHFATDLGLGVRALLGDFFAVSVTYLNTLYSDRPGGNPTSRSQTENLGMVQLGVSFFLPPHFEYEVH
jgi:outer membrane beta-barrel protein